MTPTISWTKFLNSLALQLEEAGHPVGNPVHKLLAKLPNSLDAFKDNVHMRLPMPTYPETVSLLYDKCLMRGQGKTDAALVAQGKGKGKPKGKGHSSQARSSEQKGNKAHQPGKARMHLLWSFWTS